MNFTTYAHHVEHKNKISLKQKLQYIFKLNNFHPHVEIKPWIKDICEGFFF
jgi:hypothetical protein